MIENISNIMYFKSSCYILLNVELNNPVPINEFILTMLRLNSNFKNPAVVKKIQFCVNW